MKLYPKTSSERRRKKKTNWTVEHEAGNDLLEAQRVLEDTRGRVNSISTIFFRLSNTWPGLESFSFSVQILFESGLWSKSLPDWKIYTLENER